MPGANRRRKRTACTLAALVAGCLCGAGPALLRAGEGDTAPGYAVYAALRALRPDGRVAAVHGLVLARDAFRIQLASGTLCLLAPVAGRTVGAVFLGRGTLELNPPEPAERHQLALELAAGGEHPDSAALHDDFTEMVLLWTDGTAAEIERHAALEQRAPDAHAAEVWERWFARQRRELQLNLQLRLARNLLAPPGVAGDVQAPPGATGERPARGVFLALFEGRTVPPALLAVDPEGVAGVLRGSRLGGETAMLYVADERRGGLWYLGGPSSGGGAAPPAEALHYRVETTVRRDADLAGVTTIRLRVREPGLRILPIQLAPRLRLAEASFEAPPAAAPAAVEPKAAAPAAVEIIQEDAAADGADAAVIFPRPLAEGEELLLRLAYQGDAVLRDAGDRNYYVEARTSWYPNLGVFGTPATFDLVYRVPAGNQVVSVGRLLSTREEGGDQVTEWRSAGGIRVAGFNYGRFKKIERHDAESGVDLAVYTNPGTPDAVRLLNAAMQGEPRGTNLLPPGTLYNTAPQPTLGVINTARLAEAAMADAVNAARVYTTYFGPLADRHVAITQQSQWIFGQSWPSLVFLPYISFLDGTQRQRLGMAGAGILVDQLGLHELAHQWWGHLVGAASFRDAWLEEGFAEFSAALALQHARGWGAYDAFWRATRRRLLSRPRHSAVANLDAGPLTQGFRLATARSPDAFQALVYGKGAYVLHMLRMLMWDGAAAEPDRRFIDMMHDYTATFAGRQATTADFQHVVERHMTPAMNVAGDHRMDWFFRQWVYGVELPRYTADLRVTTSGGRIHVEGKVRQDSVSPDFRATLPIYLAFEHDQYARIGQLQLSGATEVPVNLTLESSRKPLGVVVNARGEVLAREE